MVPMATGHANMAALEVHWFQHGLDGELAIDSSLAGKKAAKSGKEVQQHKEFANTFGPIEEIHVMHEGRERNE